MLVVHTCEACIGTRAWSSILQLSGCEAHLMEEVQQQRVVLLVSKVLLEYAVDTRLQDDVVIACHQTNLHIYPTA